MKGLYCGYCHTIIGLPGSTDIVSCRCRPTSPRDDDGHGRCRGRWVYPEKGFAIFTEIAQGGAESDDLADMVDVTECAVCGSSQMEKRGGMVRCVDEKCGTWGSTSPVSLKHKRGTAISAPRALYGFGLHNNVLPLPGPGEPNYECWRYAKGSLFLEKKSVFITFRPGESGDTAYVSEVEFAQGDWPEERRMSIPPEQRIYADR